MMRRRGGVVQACMQWVVPERREVTMCLVCKLVAALVACYLEFGLLP